MNAVIADARANGKKVIFKIKEYQKITCCAKHCYETKGLKVGMGWNRWHFGENDMIKNIFLCELCFDEMTTSKCKCCGETYKYTEMQYKDGGNFGEALYGYNDFFCVPCIKQLFIRSI